MPKDHRSGRAEVDLSSPLGPTFINVDPPSGRRPTPPPAPPAPQAVQPVPEPKTAMPPGTLSVVVLGKLYDLKVIPIGRDVEALVQYMVTSPKGENYVISVDLTGHAHCPCASNQYRKEGIDPAGCKHIIALRAAGLLHLRWRKAPCPSTGSSQST